MEGKKMPKPKASAAIAFVLIMALLLSFQPTALFATSLKKSVTAMEDGKYLIKVRVTASSASIYTLKLQDPKASIIDVYAPKGWCIVTDGEEFLAKTSGAPIKANKTVEFIIHSSSADVSYEYSVHGLLKQIGKPGTI
jgi:hypothetical protein